MGGASKYTVELPDGKKHNLHNGDRGFFKRSVHKLRCTEGILQMVRPMEFRDSLKLGKATNFASFPGTLDVSKHHLDVACVNNYYFLKDAGSKRGTYLKLTNSGKNKRIELHKGMTFAVGRLQLKVQNLEGDCADNKKLKEKVEEAARERAEANKDKDKEDEALDDDEEFADDSDEDDGGGGKKGKLDGPAVMFLASIDKKSQVKGRIRETSTIGSDKEKNKISISSEMAKEKKIDAVHTRIVLEDGHFYLESGGGGFGTFVGLPKKKFVEVHGGDKLLVGSARCKIEALPATFAPLDGLIDKILGKRVTNVYDMKVVGSSASIEERLQAARKEHDA